MGSLSSFLFVYLLGGLTFIPLLFALIALHAYLTLPCPAQSTQDANDRRNDGLEFPGDDENSLRTVTDSLEEKFRRSHESDVAAGYFTVCREYTPTWFNAKAPVRPAPAGEPTAAESASVYQTMYSTLFSRSQNSNLKRAKTTDKIEKRANDLFFVVLRHGHLMLYDDTQQIDVRYIISLAHHNVSIYSGGADIPEEELWAKRNAIRLTRRPDPTSASHTPSRPFYIFSENLSEKEDLYFAMLRNKEKMPGSAGLSPSYLSYDARHIIDLLQRLYSSEEQQSTRWINAILGRLFLALYRTPEMEESVKRKIAKKISRAKTPNFITKLAVRKVNMGDGAPFINNPRLRELTLDGDCIVGVDFSYTGNFRLEVSATVHIDLGTRFKSREVDLVLAVVLNRVDGHCLLRLKPPPSNRIWFAFETMPTVIMSIEPIFGTRQITYGVVLRAIENRIREVISETIVLPFWEDIPFFDTSSCPFRGGIWQTRNFQTDKETNAQGSMGAVTDDKRFDSESTPAGSLDIGHALVANTSGPTDLLNDPSGTQSGLVSTHLEPRDNSDIRSSTASMMDYPPSQLPGPSVFFYKPDSPGTTGAAADAADAEHTGIPDVSRREGFAKQGCKETTVTQQVLSMNTPVSPDPPCQRDTPNDDDVPRVTSVLSGDKGDKSGLSARSQTSRQHRLSLSTSEVETTFATPAAGELSRRRNTFEFLPSRSSTSLRERYQGIRFLRSATSTPRSWSWKGLVAKENMRKADMPDNTTSGDKQPIPQPRKGSEPEDERPILECDLPISGTESTPLSLTSDVNATAEIQDRNHCLLEDETRLTRKDNAVSTQGSEIHKDTGDEFHSRSPNFGRS
ncbi:hypothetical protein DTO021C3_6176 [Paecilomyces variotii]|nr:hypothetical protein DTO021C3_6176 [Paecilomyces variotii]